RISLEIEAMRLGQETIDPYIAILDSKRFELAVSDDTPLLAQDGHLSVTVPEDGTYVIEVRESSYDAQRKAQYRLHIGDFPRPTAVFPPGGKTGEEIEITFRGDAGGDITTRVKLPDTATAAFPVFAERDGVFAPSPNYLRVAPYGSVADLEPNNHRKQATAAPSPAPLAFHGIIAEPKDQDWFLFPAKKGQAFTIQTFARSLRSPLDAVTNIYYAKDGKRIEGSDDKDGSPDGSFTFKVPEDGDYILSVRDHLYNGGPDYVYRIETIPSDPFLQVNIPQFDRNDTQQRQWVPVPRGNRYATLLNVTRANCKGDVRFIAENLPPGITLHAETLPDGQGQFPVVFEAAADAAVGGFLAPLNVALTERPEVAGTFSQKLEMPRSLNNRKPWRLVQNDLLPVSVTEESPFKIEVEIPAVPVVQAGTLGLKIKATRKQGFTAPINLRMLWKPPGIGANNTVQIPKEKNAITYNINANGNAQLREWKIAVLGEADAGSGQVLASSALTPVKVEAPFLRMKFEMVSVVKGGQVDFVADIEHLRPFEGTARVKIYGLPAHCTTTDELEITKDDLKITFPVTTTEKSPVGKHKNLFCNVWVPLSGTTVHHTVAQGGTIRIDNPPPPEPPAEEKVAQAPPQ
ncbi:MAG: hypothetical protein P8J87_00310, partial [Verrucomicrobiales bacterium]|nr:hypothetical protein [Verrucomicrobiales bacterium]